VSKRAKKEKALPLDSPDWMPLEDVHRLRCQLTGDPGLAAQDVTNVLARRVRSMRRWRVGGFERSSKPDRTRLPFTFWAEHELHWSDGLSVIRRPHFADILSDIIILQGFVGYAWKPDLADIWPTLFGSPPAQQATTTTPQPATISDKPRSRAQAAIRQFAAKRWPGGWEYVASKVLVKVVGDELGEKRDTILRALGRRKG